MGKPKKSFLVKIFDKKKCGHPQGGHTTSMIEDQGTVIPSTVSINGQEYDVSDAQRFIDLGKKTSEAEQRYNTTLDTVWPEYGKLNQTKKQLEQELQDAKTQLQEFQAKQEKGIETPVDLTEAREAARKLGLTLKEDLDKKGYIRKNDLDNYLD